MRELGLGTNSGSLRRRSKSARLQSYIPRPRPAVGMRASDPELPKLAARHHTVADAFHNELARAGKFRGPHAEAARRRRLNGANPPDRRIDSKTSASKKWRCSGLML